MDTLTNNREYRYSGHGTFPCRFTWLPKAVRHIAVDDSILGDDDRAMVAFGVGKNMVRAICYWVEATGVAKLARDGKAITTDFGRLVLAENGFDPYLEDDQTLWMLHWNLATQAVPAFAWHTLLNFWNKQEFTHREALKFLQKEAKPDLAEATLNEHLTVFLHSYLTRAAKKDMPEEGLDCPLVELEFIREVTERPTDQGRSEKVYGFHSAEKTEISKELFIYCLANYWAQKHAGEKTVSFAAIAVGEGSPGQIFRMPEQETRARLEEIGRDSKGQFTYEESASMQQVVCRQTPSTTALLRKIYSRDR